MQEVRVVLDIDSVAETSGVQVTVPSAVAPSVVTAATRAAPLGTFSASLQIPPNADYTVQTISLLCQLDHSGNWRYLASEAVAVADPRP